MSGSEPFTHFDGTGRTQMVDVSSKEQTHRIAVAEAYVRMQSATRQQIEAQAMKKGDVLAVSELAGIMGAKRTSDLIPLCHPLPLTKVTVQAEWVGDTLTPRTAAAADQTDADQMTGDSAASSDSSAHTSLLRLVATTKTTYQTGVEMEALTACTVAALTVYDMCKAVDRAMSIENVRLLHKEGGKSGTFDAQ